MNNALNCTFWDGDIVVKYEAGFTKPTITTMASTRREVLERARTARPLVVRYQEGAS